MSHQVYRHELKYLISMQEWALLRQRLMPLAERDRNAGPSGEYWIRSLYFDDYFHTAYNEKELGVLTRYKYRIRVYNCSDAIIRLERKSKFGQYIHKESAPLTREQVEAILDGDYDFLIHSEHNLLREFYFECTSRLMRPRVIVDYDREPFIFSAGDVRITFDKHVRAGFGRFLLFDAELPTVDVVSGNRMILEVKFTQFLPTQIRRLLALRASQLTSASKYVLCCDAAVREHSNYRVEGIVWKMQ
ncbi:MAG: polyphosphate polymerase domain-containing protein [Clostridia bacterium]